MSKVVYILGAGFSRPAGVPTQLELTKELFNEQYTEFKDARQELEKLTCKQKKLIEFLKSEFGLDQTSNITLSLEDLYTPLDRCIQENSNYRTYLPEELQDLRKTLDSILILALKNKSSLQNETRFEYIKTFAKHLISLSEQRVKNKRLDPVSVITTNWDILLDNAIHEALDPEKGVIDYMCYVSSLKRDPSIIPGLKALEQNKFIVKLLKLHGSINWLHCSKCQRVFIDFYRKVTDYGLFNKRECKYCMIEQDHSSNPKLKTMLSMPTFLKDLNNFQSKLIWRNASLEIAEADKIVFIGYSFPLADFELRQLLFRHMRKTAKIEVVLYDKRKGNSIILSKNDNQKISQEDTAFRFLSFFSGKDVRITYEGAEHYIFNKFS